MSSRTTPQRLNGAQISLSINQFGMGVVKKGRTAPGFFFFFQVPDMTNSLDPGYMQCCAIL